jgi:hypothetical protein
MEIVVEAYDEQERAMGWHYYLEGEAQLPLPRPVCCQEIHLPLKVEDEVEVIGMPPEEECEHEMLVLMRWGREGLAIPLSQLEVIDADDQTREAVQYWLY